MRFEQVDMTPELAKQLLGRNENNRNIARGRVNALARDMASGAWKTTPHGVVVGADGRLIDGQHRLHAVVKAGLTVPMVVVRDAPNDCVWGIDRGGVRKPSHDLKMQGSKHPSLLATCARYIRYLENGVDISITSAETQRELERCFAATGWVRRMTLTRGFGAAYVIAPLMWLYSDFRDEATLFQEEVGGGAGLARNSPALTLRNAILLRESRAGASHTKAMMMKTLNAFRAYVNDRPMKRVNASQAGWDYFRRLRNLPLLANSDARQDR